MPEILKGFNPFRVRIEARPQGVEASAGTGKTYSIAILALRMIVEQDMVPGNLLMVTFTNAAVAELEIRVRSFIRKALKVARDPNADVGDSKLKALVLQYLNNQDAEVVQRKLHDAALQLENLSVFTFHSFCTRVLRDFSFETKQLFDAEMMSVEDWNTLIEDQFNQFWRDHIAVLPVDILQQLIVLGNGETPLRIRVMNLVREAFKGKMPYVWSRPMGGYLNSNHLDSIRSQPQHTQRVRQAFAAAVGKHLDELKALTIKSGRHAIKNFQAHLEAGNFDGFIDALHKAYKDDTAYAKAVCPPIQHELDAWLEAVEDEIRFPRLVLAQIAEMAYEHIHKKVDQKRFQLASQTFDDLIQTVRRTVENTDSLERVRENLRKRYLAVFIDEFQDTDSDQYNIFNNLFGDGHILYYIGDPKQSIYSFRKADIQTYLHAMRRVDLVHQMNENHRSSPLMIDAMNLFFKPNPDFDTFLYGEELPYIQVDSPENNQKGILCVHQQPAAPIGISFHSNEEKRYAALANLVIELVNGEAYSIFEKGKHRKINFSDIGIVVRKNSHSRSIQRTLSKAGIPVVTVDDTAILLTDEAKDLYLIIEAILERTRGAINKAMLTRLAACPISRLSVLKEEHLMDRFRTYWETWTSRGVYEMLKQFMADQQVFDRFYQGTEPGAERSVANFLQLADLLHRISVEEGLGPVDLMRWLKKGTEGRLLEGDEYVQRLERDEASVKIVTIHKAKGLEYPIVICPDLDMKPVPVKNRPAIWQEDSSFFSVEPEVLPLNPDKERIFRLQQRRENRRLLYVAITRARQACFIITGGADPTAETKKQKSEAVASNAERQDSLTDFLLAIVRQTKFPNPELIRKLELPEEEAQAVRSGVPGPATIYSTIGDLTILDSHWRKTSFSGLSPEHHALALPRPSGESMSELDRFLFTQLRRGSQSGDLMHGILESIDFSFEQGWPDVVSRMVDRYVPYQTDVFRKNITDWLGIVTRVPILPRSDFSLSMLTRHARKSELEFNFSLSSFSAGDLEELTGPDAPIRIRGGQLEGLMNGFIDLLFFHEGKYYILDWKTNYLGGAVDDYRAEGLAVAMAENNYHLQYLIYTVAVKRYLNLRIPDFDYETHFGGVVYLFLRGMRENSTRGVFFTRPEQSVIERIDGLFLGKPAEQIAM